jgi:hypothetical protein
MKLTKQQVEGITAKAKAYNRKCIAFTVVKESQANGARVDMARSEVLVAWGELKGYIEACINDRNLQVVADFDRSAYSGWGVVDKTTGAIKMSGYGEEIGFWD